MQLRPYQATACDKAKAWLKSSIDPCLIDAAPAAGKSFMIAALADWLHAVSKGKRVLVLAPSAELVKQNAEKFAMTGHPFSIFSASAGAKSTRNVIVFGTPGTVKNAISRFNKPGVWAGVIVDECHGITPTIKAIIEAMREANPQLRVIGLSGTPFRLGQGYIYRIGPDGRANGDDTCRDPYFTKCVERVSARKMLDEGFITPMVVGGINAGAYDTSGIHLLANGTFDPGDVERAFVGHGRKTASIVADVLTQAQGRRGGVMLFAASVAHANEIMASLPPASSALVTGDTDSGERRRIIAAYRAKKVRYLVSVGTLTTGFDVSHTEVIALLRKTESASLLTQILGRAWRLDDDKADSLLLDYADNVSDHFPDGDIYEPTIKATKGATSGEPVEAHCPSCGHVNEFSRHKDAEGYQLDQHGYCLDVFGQQVVTEYGPMSGHTGRRCHGVVRVGAQGQHDRCGYYYTSRECEACGEKNDIAARRCRSCKAEIIDPNEKLVAEFKALKRDPTVPQTDKVLSLDVRECVSQKGNPVMRADWKTDWRQFSTWHQMEAKHARGVKDWERFAAATQHGPPETVSYLKEDSGFYRIICYGAETDSMP